MSKAIKKKKKLKEIAILTIAQLRTQMSNLTSLQSGSLLNHIVSNSNKDWEKKAAFIIENLGSQSSLYKAGKKLHGQTFLSLLNKKNGDYLSQLQPLLLGMKAEEVTHLLVMANLQQLGVLHTPKLMEALHQQLDHILVYLEKEERELTTILEDLKQSIASLDAYLLEPEKLIGLRTSIEESRVLVENQIGLIDRCLAVAWHHSDSDQIEKFNQLKEYYRNDLRVGIGHPSCSGDPGSGLYFLLENRLGQPFIGLTKDAPASEALAALGVLTYGDLQEIGIINKVPKNRLNSLLLFQEAESKDPLVKSTSKALLKRGLTTVSDFIKAGICSKAMLQEASLV